MGGKRNLYQGTLRIKALSLSLHLPFPPQTLLTPRRLVLQDEIRTIVQKRNQHEHKVLAPGNTPYDWSSYAQWEQSLETLRAKRCRRLQIRHLASAHAGQGRVLGIYERGAGRHPGSGALWREYLAYTAGVKASKRWRKTVTSALRMLPTDADLWVVAGRRSAHNGDMAAARGFFMRGCRFCTTDDRLWVEYARCEMEWLARMEDKRRKGKSSIEAAAIPARRPAEDDELRIDDSDDEGEDEDGVILPEPSKAQAKVIDKAAARQLAASNPALDGAIPMAIFDIARKQPFYAPDVAERFFLMFATFRQQTPVYARVSQHVLAALEAQAPKDPATASCLIRQPLAGVSPLTADFPRGLREALPRIAEQLAATSDREALVRKTEAWIDECLAVEGLDDGIKTVLEHTKSSLAEETK